MMQKEKNDSDIEGLLEIMDPQTDKHMLPPAYRCSDNRRKLSYCRRAMREAVAYRLTPTQRKNLDLYYREQLPTCEIAQKRSMSRSAVSKSLDASRKAIREYVEMYMRIYESLEKELLSDDYL